MFSNRPKFTQGKTKSVQHSVVTNRQSTNVEDDEGQSRRARNSSPLIDGRPSVASRMEAQATVPIRDVPSSTRMETSRLQSDKSSGSNSPSFDLNEG